MTNISLDVRYMQTTRKCLTLDINCILCTSDVKGETNSLFLWLEYRNNEFLYSNPFPENLQIFHLTPYANSILSYIIDQPPLLESILQVFKTPAQFCHLIDCAVILSKKIYQYSTWRQIEQTTRKYLTLNINCILWRVKSCSCNLYG